LEDQEEVLIHGVVTTEGDYLEFARGAVVADSVIVGTAKEGGYKVIPLDQVKIVYIQEDNTTKSCCVVGSAIGVMFLVIGAALDSDFVESWFEGLFGF
jgi:hypothetical protein